MSGYPVGVALALLFIGLENGAEFASRSALFNIAGVATFLVFIGLYYATSRLPMKNTIGIASLVATVGFFAVSYFFQSHDFTAFSSTVVAFVAIVFFGILFAQIRTMQTGARVTVTLSSIMLRGLFAGGIIVGITSAAKFAGPEWAGLLAAFPATTFPLMLMIHHRYSTMHFQGFVKYIPTSSLSIVAYVLAVYWSYPLVGVVIGTIFAYGVATIIILLLYFIEEKEIFKKIAKKLYMVKSTTIHFVITGGTIDFHYERRHDTVVPNKESIIPKFIGGLDYIDADFTELFIKDSRNLSKADFKTVLKTVEKSPYKKVIITTGTFKIDQLAMFLEDNMKEHSKTILLTGSTTPIVGFTPSEGLFNLGHAIASVQSLDVGIYISFNGELFTKNDINRLINEGGLSTIFQIGIQSPLV